MNVKPCTGRILTVGNIDHLLTIEVVSLDSDTILIRAKITGTQGRESSLLIEKEIHSDVIHRSVAKGNIQLVCVLYDFIAHPNKYY
jgi:hypothetical protein